MTIKVKRDELIKKLEAARAEAKTQAAKARDERIESNKKALAQLEKNQKEAILTLEAHRRLLIDEMDKIIRNAKAGKGGIEYNLPSVYRNYDMPKSHKPAAHAISVIQNYAYQKETLSRVGSLAEFEQLFTEKFDKPLSLLKMSADETITLSDKSDQFGLMGLVQDIL